MRDHQRREAEIGLGLAAAGREEQEVGCLAVSMRAIDQPGHIEQHKGELERPPLRLIERVRIAGRAGDAAAGRHGDGEIHEAEGRPRLGVACENIDAVRDPVLRGLHLGDKALAGFAAARGKTGELVALGVDPNPVEDGQIGQGRSKSSAIALGQLRERSPCRT